MSPRIQIRKTCYSSRPSPHKAWDHKPKIDKLERTRKIKRTIEIRISWVTYLKYCIRFSIRHNLRYQNLNFDTNRTLTSLTLSRNFSEMYNISFFRCITFIQVLDLYLIFNFCISRIFIITL